MAKLQMNVAMHWTNVLSSFLILTSELLGRIRISSPVGKLKFKNLSFFKKVVEIVRISDEWSLSDLYDRRKIK